MIFGGQLIKGQNPPDVKWRQIRTPHFKVIFPAEIKNTGQEVANTLEYIYFPDGKTLNTNPAPLNVYLYNRKVMSNGFFTLAPRRSVFYNTSPQNHNLLGCADWYKILSVHEFRHCNQFTATNQNFTKFASWLYGDYGQYLPWLSVPNWFFEGDAVLTETALTNHGRGRVPHFDMHFRSLLLEDVEFSYHNAKLLSYKNYYPGHYSLGYLLITNIRRNHGYRALNKTIARSSWLPFYPYSFSNSLQKYTGNNSGETFKKTMNELDSIWEQRQKLRNIHKPSSIHNKQKKIWTNYCCPYAAKTNGIIALKSGMKDPGSVVLLKDNKKEEKLFDIQANCYFPDGKYIHSNGQQVVWASSRDHLRWSEAGYSEIWLYDIKANRIRKITSSTRFQSPAISPDGKAIVAVENTIDNKYNLAIINSESGKVLNRFKVFNNHPIRRPDWSPAGNKIVFAHNNGYGEGIAIFDLSAKQFHKIIKCSDENLGEPAFLDQNNIIYQSSFSGVDNIYKVNINSGQIEKLTSAKCGAYYPFYDSTENRLYYSSYSPKGFNIASDSLKELIARDKAQIEPKPTDYFKPVLKQEQGKGIFKDSIPDRNYDIQPYHADRHLFNIHSWGIYPEKGNLAAKIISDNDLQTLHTEAGLGYNSREKKPSLFFRANFRRYFPVISLEGIHSRRFTSGITTNDWLENRFSAGLSLPLNLSRRVWNTDLELEIQAEYLHIQKVYDGFIPERNYYPLSYSLDFQRNFHRAPRDFAPRFGQNLQLELNHTPFDDSANSYFSLYSRLFLPGIRPHHSFQLHFNYEQRTIEKYIFPGNRYFVRGYDYEIFDNISRLTIDYKLPLFYPDWNFLSLLYIKRIRSGIFYDHGIARRNAQDHILRSTGTELTFDFNLFNLPYTISSGVRLTKCLDRSKDYVYSLLLLGITLY
jgi:hypothetical protein